MYNSSSLYIHIPFCRTICTYCDFKKFIYNQERVNGYFESLFLQLSSYTQNKYKTIYIGGGTPSCIDVNHLEKLLQILSNMLSNHYQEFCIECNVEDINEELLNLFMKYKINRVSIGIQTFNERLIAFCGRHHNKEMAIEKIKLAATMIPNISVDMIFAFPNQTIKDLKKDLEIVTSLPIKHISYYSLLVEKNTILYVKGYQDVADDMQAKMYTLIYQTLKKKGFKRYEISNFSKAKKYQSYHNKTYWHNQHYDAVGVNASGYKKNIRYTNNSNILKYIQNDFHYEQECYLTIEDRMFDEIMLNLRLDEGLDIQRFNQKYKTNFLEKYKEAIEYNQKYKLIEFQDGKMKTTFKGSLLLNQVLEKFLN